MTKYLFLDIDGVLNSDEVYQQDPKHAAKCNGIIGIEKTKVKLLKKIIDATNAKIVLVSTWKSDYVNYLKHKETKEFDVCDVYGKYLYNKLSSERLHIFATTESYEKNCSTRGYGISKFLETHPADSWIVLDDEIFDDYSDYNIMPHLIKTTFWHGLTDEHVEKAIKLLNSEN